MAYDFSALEAEVRRACFAIKQELADAFVPGMALDIEVRGRTEGPLRITFKLGDNGYDIQSPSGATVRPLIDELLRRREWKAQHDAKLLSGPCEVAPDYEQESPPTPAPPFPGSV